MSQYCLIGSAVLCYVSVAVTTAGCAVAYLAGRFKSGNCIDSILFGGPQYVFYTLNIGAGLFTLFASESLGGSHIIEKAVSDLSLAIVQASGLAFATFIGFRTTVKNGENIEIGPGRLFAVLLDNVERRIDQNRTVKATKDILGLAKLPTPRAVLNVVLPYCFDQAEKDPGNRPEITKTLEAIVTDGDRNAFPRERAILMLSHLHKSFGIEVVVSAIKLVDGASIISLDKSTASSPPPVGTEASNAIQSSDAELDGILQQLRVLQQSRRS